MEIASSALENTPDVMVVEDDPTIRDVLQILFQLESIHACWVSTGGEALNMLEHLPRAPKMVLVDGRLPDIHGLELASIMRGRLLPSTSIYLCSADPECQRGIFGSQISGFIAKPFDADEVVELIKSRLAVH